MKENKVTLREWQRRFLNGDFKDSTYEEELGDWRDIEDIARLLPRIKHPFLLDQCYMGFYDSDGGCDNIYFDPMLKEYEYRREADAAPMEQIFMVCINDKRSDYKWSLITRRLSDVYAEFECRNVRTMAKYIDRMADEIEQHTIPPFVKEMQALSLALDIHYGRYRIDGNKSADIQCSKPIIHRMEEHAYSFTLMRYTYHMAAGSKKINTTRELIQGEAYVVQDGEQTPDDIPVLARESMDGYCSIIRREEISPDEST